MRSESTLEMSSPSLIVAPFRQPCLLFLTGLDAGRILPLGDLHSPLLIGRSEDCDVTVDSPEISRLHAQIERNQKGRLVIVDLDSVNGTFVNDERIKKAELGYDDKIKIGPYLVLKLSYHDQEEIGHFQQFFNRATTDHLTGLVNRRFFLLTLRQEWSYARRHHYRLSLAMLDIDHFKPINDTFGHLEGDKVLVEFVRRVQEQIRLEDLFCRFGGEEFMLLLRETDETGAVTAAQRIRRVISKTPFQLDQTRVPVTVSIGVVAYNAIDIETKRVEDLIGEVDKELYRAKAAGRNCVMASSFD
ncbi:MAG: GGDEF domain-containing protein [Bradymonadales bacterium]|nr:GGDEF domain-containing protein [Bradymonadales bacterium]